MDELDDLDHAVARALGGELDGDGWRFPSPLEMYGDSFIKTKRSFCRDWSYGGPIIERERIWLSAWPDGTWGADIAGERGDPRVNQDPKPGEPGHVKATAHGNTPLIAAMRCFVASASSEPS